MDASHPGEDAWRSSVHLLDSYLARIQHVGESSVDAALAQKSPPGKAVGGASRFAPENETQAPSSLNSTLNISLLKREITLSELQQSIFGAERKVGSSCPAGFTPPRASTAVVISDSQLADSRPARTRPPRAVDDLLTPITRALRKAADSLVLPYSDAAPSRATQSPTRPPGASERRSASARPPSPSKAPAIPAVRPTTQVVATSVLGSLPAAQHFAHTARDRATLAARIVQRAQLPEPVLHADDKREISECEGVISSYTDEGDVGRETQSAEQLRMMDSQQRRHEQEELTMEAAARVDVAAGEHVLRLLFVRYAGGGQSRAPAASAVASVESSEAVDGRKVSCNGFTLLAVDSGLVGGPLLRGHVDVAFKTALARMSGTGAAAPLPPLQLWSASSFTVRTVQRSMLTVGLDFSAFAHALSLCAETRYGTNGPSMKIAQLLNLAPLAVSLGLISTIECLFQRPPARSALGPRDADFGPRDAAANTYATALPTAAHLPGGFSQTEPPASSSNDDRQPEAPQAKAAEQATHATSARRRSVPAVMLPRSSNDRYPRAYALQKQAGASRPMTAGTAEDDATSSVISAIEAVPAILMEPPTPIATREPRVALPPSRDHIAANVRAIKEKAAARLRLKKRLEPDDLTKRAAARPARVGRLPMRRPSPAQSEIFSDVQPVGDQAPTVTLVVDVANKNGAHHSAAVGEPAVVKLDLSYREDTPKAASKPPPSVRLRARSASVGPVAPRSASSRLRRPAPQRILPPPPARRRSPPGLAAPSGYGALLLREVLSGSKSESRGGVNTEGSGGSGSGLRPGAADLSPGTARHVFRQALASASAGPQGGDLLSAVTDFVASAAVRSGGTGFFQSATVTDPLYHDDPSAQYEPVRRHSGSEADDMTVTHPAAAVPASPSPLLQPDSGDASSPAAPVKRGIVWSSGVASQGPLTAARAQRGAASLPVTPPPAATPVTKGGRESDARQQRGVPTTDRKQREWQRRLLMGLEGSDGGDDGAGGDSDNGDSAEGGGGGTGSSGAGGVGLFSPVRSRQSAGALGRAGAVSSYARGAPDSPGGSSVTDGPSLNCSLAQQLAEAADGSTGDDGSDAYSIVSGGPAATPGAKFAVPRRSRRETDERTQLPARQRSISSAGRSRMGSTLQSAPALPAASTPSVRIRLHASGIEIISSSGYSGGIGAHDEAEGQFAAFSPMSAGASSTASGRALSAHGAGSALSPNGALLASTGPSTWVASPNASAGGLNEQQQQQQQQQHVRATVRMHRSGSLELIAGPSLSPAHGGTRPPAAAAAESSDMGADHWHHHQEGLGSPTGPRTFEARFPPGWGQAQPSALATHRPSPLHESIDLDLASPDHTG